MKMHYFIFESGKAVLGPFNRLVDAWNEAREYGVGPAPCVRCFETDDKEKAEKLNEELEQELAVK